MITNNQIITIKFKQDMSYSPTSKDFTAWLMPMSHMLQYTTIKPDFK